MAARVKIKQGRKAESSSRDSPTICDDAPPPNSQNCPSLKVLCESLAGDGLIRYFSSAGCEDLQRAAGDERSERTRSVSSVASRRVAAPYGVDDLALRRSGRAFLISRSVLARPPPQRARAPYVENKKKTFSSDFQA